MTIDTKFLFEILFLPGILGVGIFSSLSDIKTGKVKNSLIKKGFLYGLTIYFLLIVWTLLRRYAFYDSQLFYLKLNYFPELIINVAIAFIVGVVFWKFDIWAAADAKLFALFSFLFPLTVYTYERMPYFPSFALLVNIYIASLLYLLLTYLLRIKIRSQDFKKKFFENLPKIIQGIKIYKILDFLSVCLLIFCISFSIFPLGVGKIKASISLLIVFYITFFLILMSLGKFLNKYKKIKFFLLILAIIYIIIWFVFSVSPLLILTQFIRFIFYMAIINLVFRMLSSLGAADIEIINIEELEQNMLLTTDTLKLLGGGEEFYKNLDNIYPDGLSLEQTEKIKGFFQNKGLKTIGIHKTFPFAVFIFIGVIMTFIVRGSLIGWLIMFFR